MKALKNKQTGKLTFKFKKKPLVVHHFADPKTEETPDQKFSKNLRDSKDHYPEMEEIDSHHYKNKDKSKL